MDVQKNLLEEVEKFFLQDIDKYSISDVLCDDCARLKKRKNWSEVQYKDLSEETFLLEDQPAGSRIFLLGMIMRLSLLAMMFDAEPIKYSFRESQKRKTVPITERNSFLRDYLTGAQKAVVLEYCQFASRHDEAWHEAYWSNLLGGHRSQQT